MKIAYLILAHTNPNLLKRSIGRLSSPDCAFFIHIDRKSDISRFSGIEGDNIHFSKERVLVHWGEFSVVRSILLLLRTALRASQRYDYFALISGSDYPLRSADYIREFLDNNRGTEFMSFVPMPDELAGKPLARLNKLWIESDKPVRRFAVRAAGKFGLGQRDYRKYLGDLQPFGGDAWFAITRTASQYIVDFVDKKKHVEEFFRDTVAPDEMFLQTIVGNSEFRAKVRRNVVYADWSASGPHPAVINSQHLDSFESQEKVVVTDVYGSGEALFARKFSDDSLPLVERIDEMIKRKEGI